MKELGFMFIQMGWFLMPLFLFVFIIKAEREYTRAINDRRTIRETKLEIRKIKDFFPESIKEQLSLNPMNCKENINEFMKTYKKCFRSVITYYVLWIVYIVIIGIRIYLLLSGFYAEKGVGEPIQIGVFLVLCLLEIYWFFLSPIFEYFHQDKLVEVGYWLYREIEKLKDLAIRFLLSFMGAVFSFLTLSYGNDVFQKYCSDFIVKYDIFAYLSYLGIYQYVLLNVLAVLIALVASRMKWVKKEEMKKAAKTVYACMKNWTYLAMIVINSFGNEGNKVVIATGILFLLDDYLSKEKDVFSKREKKQ